MKCAILSFLLLGALAFPLSAQGPTATWVRDSGPAERLGWQLATKAYTFRAITLYETLAITQALGLQYFELNPTQKLSPQNPVNTDQTLPPALRAELRERFKQAGVRIVGFGVVKLGADEAANRAIFDFAKEMGIQVLISEPDPDAFDLLDKLTAEYAINVAIHNHPAPSRYATPEAVLKTIAPYSHRIGVCADVGHWTRSGLNTVESLRKLEGRIHCLHFKDVDAKKNDVPWGTGLSDVAGMLRELHRQKFRGLISMEYESRSGEELVAELRASIVTFDKEAGFTLAKDLLESPRKPGSP